LAAPVFPGHPAGRRDSSRIHPHRKVGQNRPMRHETSTERLLRNAARVVIIATALLGGPRRAWPPLFSIRPPRSETAALEAARAADLVIVPCRPQIVDLETVPTTTELLALARDPLAVAVLVEVPSPWAAGRPSPAVPSRVLVCVSVRIRTSRAEGLVGEDGAEQTGADLRSYRYGDVGSGRYRAGHGHN